MVEHHVAEDWYSRLSLLSLPLSFPLSSLVQAQPLLAGWYFHVVTVLGYYEGVRYYLPWKAESPLAR